MLPGACSILFAANPRPMNAYGTMKFHFTSLLRAGEKCRVAWPLAVLHKETILKIDTNSVRKLATDCRI
jgi:hypothetical protein